VKVLILHQFYNTPSTGGAIRSYYLANALADNGILPVVLTTHNYPEVRKTDSEGIEVHYLPVTYNNRYGFFRRVFSFLKFVWSTVAYAGKFRDVDIVYAISTPLTTGLAALWIKFRYRIPYYFEVGDLWPEAPIQMGFVRNPILKFILYKLERLIYRQSKAIVALSPAIRQNILKKVPHKEVYFIPNMADIDFFAPEPKPVVLEDRYGVKGKFVVAYLGAFGLANGLEYIIECAVLAMKGNLPIHFILAGDGKVSDELEKSVMDKGLGNMSILPFRNRDGVKEILAVTDAVFVCYRDIPVLETGSPNKFFDGLAAGKLIILNFGGWLKEEIKNCGISVDPENPGDFLEKVKEFISNPAKLEVCQKASRLLAETKYSRKIVSKAFTDLFEEITIGGQ
jgi:glycosyltransferase involved in cell wall biosynthesis